MNDKEDGPYENRVDKVTEEGRVLRIYDVRVFLKNYWIYFTDGRG